MDREPQMVRAGVEAGCHVKQETAFISGGRSKMSTPSRARSSPLVRARQRALGKRFESLRVERMLTLAEHLSPPDRALIDAVYRKGMSIAAVARAAAGGPSERVLRARLRRLVRRLLDRRAEGVARAIRFDLGWPAQRREIARCRYFEFATMREIARRFGLSMHQARKKVWEIDAIASEVAP